jgi:hypothetical protein
MGPAIPKHSARTTEYWPHSTVILQCPYRTCVSQLVEIKHEVFWQDLRFSQLFCQVYVPTGKQTIHYTRKGVVVEGFGDMSVGRNCFFGFVGL